MRRTERFGSVYPEDVMVIHGWYQELLAPCRAMWSPAVVQRLDWAARTVLSTLWMVSPVPAELALPALRLLAGLPARIRNCLASLRASGGARHRIGQLFEKWWPLAD